MKQFSYTKPKTKWQLAVSIEEYAEKLKYNPWGAMRMMTISYNYYTKEELKIMYENLKNEYDN